MSLNILFYSPDGKPDPWIEGFARELPEAQLQELVKPQNSVNKRRIARAPGDRK